MDDRTITIFADGAATGNPGPGGWGAIIVTPDGKVTELGGGVPHTTNNKMELTAVIEALRDLRDLHGKVTLYSDSTYVVRGISQWIRAWKRRGWKTIEGSAVLNRDLWETLDRLVSERGLPDAVTWCHVPGHAGVGGNERADQIARAYATSRQPDLYRGPLCEYPENILAFADHANRTAAKSSGGGTGSGKGGGRGRGKGKAAYSYLSVVDGKPMRHKTWAECEERVRGKSRALFKKASNPRDEIDILRAWGFSLEDLP
jgi:ribonuclease HI